MRHKERTRYIRNKNPISAYTLQVLNNTHEYGTAEGTLKLLKSRRKGTRMNCLEAFYMQAFHQHKILIKEQQVSDINPLSDLAHTSRDVLRVP